MLAIVAALELWLHASVVLIAEPITQDEPGFVELTAFVGNPYTLDGIVRCANIYGPAYPLWARPFTAVISSPYIALRVANAVALAASLGLLASVLRRRGISWLGTGAGVVFVYALNVNSHSLAGGADMLAMVLYLATVSAGEIRRPWGTTAVLILAALATLAKPYGLLAWGIVASHRVLFAPLREGVRFLGWSALVAGVAGGLLHTVAPLYFFSTFTLHRLATLPIFGLFLAQNYEFVLLTGGLLFLALAQWPTRRTLQCRWQAPLISPPCGLWEWATLAATAAVLSSLSWHAGNFLVYHFHLLLVPLAIAALSRLPAWPRLGPALLAGNALVVIWQMPPLPRDDNWPELASTVRATHGAMLLDPLLAPLAPPREGVELFEHGQTATVLAMLDRVPAVAATQPELRQRLDTQASALVASINAEKFEAIYLTYELVPGTHWRYHRERFWNAITAHYVPAGSTPVFPYYAAFWERSLFGRHPLFVSKWLPRHHAVTPAPAK